MHGSDCSTCSHQPQHWNPLQFKWVKWVQSMSTDSFDVYPIHDVFICTADGSHWLDASVTTCFYRYDGNVMQVDVLPCSGRKKGKVDASQVLCLIPLVTWLSLYRSTNLWPNKTTFKLFRSYSSPPLLWMIFFFPPAFSKPLVERVALWLGRRLKRSLSSRKRRQKLWLCADS